MTSLLMGIVFIYLAVIILRMPEERFRQELDQITGRTHSERYYTVMRALVWAMGFAGGGAIVLRFF